MRRTYKSPGLEMWLEKENATDVVKVENREADEVLAVNSPLASYRSELHQSLKARSFRIHAGNIEQVFA